LKEVADRLNIHESTVSRAIHNKIVQTPRGLLKMKFLFSKGVDKKSGDAVSNDKVKKLIKEYINNEDCLKPWSDQKLADLLSEKRGINISRRTIAKYREILKIPPSNLRKRFSI
ncbi:MAG: RNA polymerase sigma-54 factor, partial [Candidatus Atribacteria bacterium]|nr:RNA polymerase sigma-54 factor [Candidatus Atribacteria bacterium]